MNKGYKGNNGISKAQVIELIVAEVAKIQTDGLDLSTYAKKSEVSTQISNAIKNFLTEEEVQALLEALDIPTKISELQNDLNLANKTYVDNAVNAKKHYTEEEIKTIVEGVLEEKEISGTVDEEAVQLIVNESLSQLNIPTKTSQLTNDSGFVTGTEVDTKIANAGAVNEEVVQSIVDTSLSQLNIPTKTSQLTNDSDFITGSEVDSKIANATLGGEVDLTSYAKKTELADKVDKVDGKSLVEDTVIEATKVLINEEKLEYIIKIDSSLSSVNLTKSIQQQFDEAYELGYRRVTFPKNTEIEVIDELDGVCAPSQGFLDKPMLRLSNNTTYDLNDSVIKIKDNNYAGYTIISMNNLTNTILKNGTIVGDKEEHIYTNYTNGNFASHEWGTCVQMSGCENCLIMNCHLKLGTGDGAYIGIGVGHYEGKGMLWREYVEVGKINTETGEPEDSEEETRSNRYYDLLDLLNEEDKQAGFSLKDGITLVPANSTGVGAGGVFSNQEANIFWYDEDKSFISYTKGEVCTPLQIPEGGRYFKLHFPNADLLSVDSSQLILMSRVVRVSKNSYIKNCLIESCRRQGVSIGGAYVSGVVDSTIRNIQGTPPQACVDIEDAGHLTRGVVLLNNNFEDSKFGVIFYDGRGHIMENCRISGIEWHAISIYAGVNATVQNCTVERSSQVVLDTEINSPLYNPQNVYVNNLTCYMVGNVRLKGIGTVSGVYCKDCDEIQVNNKDIQGIVLHNVKNASFTNSNITNLTISGEEVPCNLSIGGNSHGDKILLENGNVVTINNSTLSNFKINKIGYGYWDNVELNHFELLNPNNKILNIKNSVLKQVTVNSEIRLANSKISDGYIKKICVIYESQAFDLELDNMKFDSIGFGMPTGGSLNLIIKNSVLEQQTPSVYGIGLLASNVDATYENCRIIDRVDGYLFRVADNETPSVAFHGCELIGKNNACKIFSNEGATCKKFELIDCKLINLKAPDYNLDNILIDSIVIAEE